MGLRNSGNARAASRSCRASPRRRPGKVRTHIRTMAFSGPGALRRGLQVPDARSVLAEDLGLDLGRQLWIPVAFDELVRNLEFAEGVDLPLGVAPKARVGAPHDVVRTEIAQQRPQHMRALQRSGR